MEQTLSWAYYRCCLCCKEAFFLNEKKRKPTFKEVKWMCRKWLTYHLGCPSFINFKEGIGLIKFPGLHRVLALCFISYNTGGWRLSSRFQSWFIHAPLKTIFRSWVTHSVSSFLGPSVCLQMSWFCFFFWVEQYSIVYV